MKRPSMVETTDIVHGGEGLPDLILALVKRFGSRKLSPGFSEKNDKWDLLIFILKHLFLY